jgi:hypothetical protein
LADAVFTKSKVPIHSTNASVINGKIYINLVDESIIDCKIPLTQKMHWQLKKVLNNSLLAYICYITYGRVVTCLFNVWVTEGKVPINLANVSVTDGKVPNNSLLTSITLANASMAKSP